MQALGKADGRQDGDHAHGMSWGNCMGQQVSSATAVLRCLRTWTRHVQPNAKICILHYWQPGRIAPNPFEVCSPAEQRLVPKEQPRPPVAAHQASSTLNSTVKPCCKA